MRELYEEMNVATDGSLHIDSEYLGQRRFVADGASSSRSRRAVARPERGRSRPDRPRAAWKLGSVS